MKKKKFEEEQKTKLRGKDGFETYYSNIFKQRWQGLKNALLKETVSVSWNAGGNTSYFLDSGSILPITLMPFENSKKILDLCAAPGGKTLVLASLMEKDATLVSNDRSAARKTRLVKVCDDCLPPEMRSRVSISCSDGAKWCTRQTECFDLILLDAPCSSERHVLTDEKYLEQWSPARIKSLTIEQWSLLSSAFRMLKNGGYLMYSTCALSPDENDKVIERLFKKFNNAKAVFEDILELPKTVHQIEKFTYCTLPNAEHTKYGFHVLPDIQDGAGPLYFSLIKKELD